MLRQTGRQPANTLRPSKLEVMAVPERRNTSLQKDLSDERAKQIQDNHHDLPDKLGHVREELQRATQVVTLTLIRYRSTSLSVGYTLKVCNRQRSIPCLTSMADEGGNPNPN